MTRRGVLRRGALALAAGALGIAAFVAIRSARYRLALSDPPRSVADRAAVDTISPLTDVSFHDALGRELHGWYHSGTKGALVLAHGFGESRAQLAPEMRLLAAAGWGFLAYDAPGHGTSEGKVTWGDLEQASLRAAVDALLAEPGVDPAHVGALGFSLGGAVVALEAAHDPRVRAIVIEAAFPSLYDEILSDCGRWGHLCAWPGAFATKRTGIPVDAVRPIDAMPLLAPRPVLVVTDTALPLDHAMQRSNFDAARDPKVLYEVQGAVHGHYTELDPKGYPAALLSFLDANL